MKLLALLLLATCTLITPEISLAASTPKKGEISMEKAIEIATAKVTGKVISSEYEFEKGENVYSFDITSDNGTIHEILVSARTGKIISNTIESAAKEAAEAQADKKK